MYGPWTATEEVLYDKKEVRVLGTTDPDYVLKIREISDIAHDELGALMMMRRHSVSYGVYTPHRDAKKFCGMTDTHVWYAMRRYAGHIHYDDETRSKWRRVAQDVLAFLTQLHRACHLIHMDIKITNILANRTHTAFVVSDYELCDTPNRRLTRDYGPDYRYYYLAMGAELDQPLVSWRMDLTALGYLLAELTWNTVENRRTTFHKAIFGIRDRAAAGERIDPSGDAELVALREREMAAAHPSVLGYLRLIAERVPWDMEAPPSESLYRELLTFFL
jgi:hypothetical protein